MGNCVPYSLTYTTNPGTRPSLEQGPVPYLSCARWGRVIVTATNSQGEMVLGGVHDRCARGGRAAATATDSHGETVLGDVHGRDSGTSPA